MVERAERMVDFSLEELETTFEFLSGSPTEEQIEEASQILERGGPLFFEGEDEGGKKKDWHHQPRVPAGSPEGGEFGPGGGGGESGGGEVVTEGLPPAPVSGQDIGKLGDDRPHRTRQTEWEKSLTPEEKTSIGIWTGNKGYHSMRNCQNKGEGCTESTVKHIETMQKALNRAPEHKGTVYRGLHFNSSKERAEFLARVERDGELVDKGYTSTAYKRELAEKFAFKLTSNMYARYKLADKAVLIKLVSKRGVDISKVSRYKGESEVLMSPPSKWRLKKMRKSAYGVGKRRKDLIIMDMEEY